MALDISGPNWPPNYTPTLAEWNYQLPLGRVSRGIIQSMPCQLQTQTIYGVRTTVAPFQCIIPPLSSTMPGDWVMLFDLEYNAANFPVSLIATGPDQIALYNNPLQLEITADISDFMVMLISNAPYYWRAVVRLA